MVDKNIKKIDIHSLVPADYNPRKISEKDYENLKTSIDEFGIVAPIIINLADNTIISGHQRFDVLYYENNIDELYLLELGDIGWVFTETDLTLKDKNHEKALNLALNRIHGEFDPDKVHEVLFELEELKLDYLTGFDLELDNIDYDFITRIDDVEDDEIIDEDDFIDDEIIDEDDFIDDEIIDEDDFIDDEIIDEKPTEFDEVHKNSGEKKTSERIKRGFIKYGDIYMVGDSSFIMFGNGNNEQDRTKLFKHTSITSLKNSINIPKDLEKVKTIQKEVNYYMSNDAELIETFLIENNNICKKVP